MRFPVFEGKEIQKRQAKETEQELINGHIAPPMQLEHRATGDVKVPEGAEAPQLQNTEAKRDVV